MPKKEEKVTEEVTPEVVDSSPKAEVGTIPEMPAKVKKAVMIDGVEYTLDSSNEKLLQKLDGGKRKNDQGKWEDVQYDYLPISIVYQLMDGLFDQYDFYSEPMTYSGEEYVVNKKVYQNGSWVDGQDTVRVYEKKVKIIVTTIDYNYGSVIREVVGYAQGVASIKQLTSDPSRNGFSQKMAARARKEALKNLGRVFRVIESEGDDTAVIVEDIESAGKPVVLTAAVKSTVDSIVDDITVEMFYNKIVEELKVTNENLFEDGGIFHKATLTSILMSVKKKLDAKKGSPELKAIEKLYNELEPKCQDYVK